MAAPDLPVREVEHMAEEAADRRAEHVQDAQRASARRHGHFERKGAVRLGQAALDGQNQRSLTTIVSPGFIG